MRCSGFSRGSQITSKTRHFFLKIYDSPCSLFWTRWSVLSWFKPHNAAGDNAASWFLLPVISEMNVNHYSCCCFWCEKRGVVEWIKRKGAKWKVLGLRNHWCYIAGEVSLDMWSCWQAQMFCRVLRFVDDTRWYLGLCLSPRVIHKATSIFRRQLCTVPTLCQH